MNEGHYFKQHLLKHCISLYRCMHLLMDCYPRELQPVTQGPVGGQSLVVSPKADLCISVLQPMHQWLEWRSRGLLSKFTDGIKFGPSVSIPFLSKNLVSLTIECIRDWKEWEKEREKKEGKKRRRKKMWAYQFYYFGKSSINYIIWI